MALTNFSVENAKPSAKPVKIPDGDGLYLVVQPNGSKLWRLRYSFHSKERSLSMGMYPAVSLADARARRYEAKKLLAHGVDPSVQKKLDRLAGEAASRNTFGLVAEEYVDEFQNFATDSFASILSEARKWRLSLVAVNQTISQLPEALQHAVFGNAGTLIVFRVGALDAERLSGELAMSNMATLTQTNNYQAWIRLMHNGAPMHPRLLGTFAPPSEGARFEKVVAFTRDRHMKPRAYVEARIAASFPKMPAKRPRHKKRRDADRT